MATIHVDFHLREDFQATVHDFGTFVTFDIGEGQQDVTFYVNDFDQALKIYNAAKELVAKVLENERNKETDVLES
jgi:hypothetical protein